MYNDIYNESDIVEKISQINSEIEAIVDDDVNNLDDRRMMGLMFAQLFQSMKLTNFHF